jgi:PIN domain nuclease of toxin-antitoxin system
MIILDTHVWVWWCSKPEKIAKKAQRSIERASRLGLPAICVWEVAAKAHAGQLKFDRPYDVWIDEALAQDDRLELIDLSPRISIESVRLPWQHRDPADRIVVATARTYQAQLATADLTIRESRLAKCVWD